MRAAGLATFPTPFRGIFGRRPRSYRSIFFNQNQPRFRDTVTRAIFDALLISGSIGLHIENRGLQH